MGRMEILLALVCVVALSSTATASIECYDCSSATDNKCEDKFTAQDSVSKCTSSGSVCAKFKGTITGQNIGNHSNHYSSRFIPYTESVILANI